MALPRGVWRFFLAIVSSSAARCRGAALSQRCRVAGQRERSGANRVSSHTYSAGGALCRQCHNSHLPLCRFFWPSVARLAACKTLASRERMRARAASARQIGKWRRLGRKHPRVAIIVQGRLPRVPKVHVAKRSRSSLPRREDAMGAALQPRVPWPIQEAAPKPEVEFQNIDHPPQPVS